MYTSDPIYRKPYKPRITVQQLDKSITLYSFDPWTDVGTQGKPVYCNVALSQNTQGAFEIQIEASGYTSPFSVNDRVLIECGKQDTQMYPLLSGVIRKRGALRGAKNKLILRYVGASTAIRLNERVMYVSKGGSVQTSDGITPTPNDPNMVANQLMQDTLNLGAYPGAEVIDTSNIKNNSDVTTQVGTLSVELGELQDAVNTIEEQSGGETMVDVSDQVIFRNEFNPVDPTRGFTIKNIMESKDNADDTCYLRGKNWSYEESIFKQDSYANFIYSILPADNLDRSTVGIGSVSYFDLSANTVVQKFKPPYSRFYPGDISIGGRFHTFDSVGDLTRMITLIVYIVQDSGGRPLNGSGMVCQMRSERQAMADNENGEWQLYPMRLIGTPAGSVIPYIDLDTTKDYWLMVTTMGGSSSSGDGFHWATRVATGGSTLYQSRSGLSFTPPNAGDWSSATVATSLAWFEMPRLRSQMFQMFDTKALDAMDGGTDRGGLIEATLTGVPSFVRNKEGMYRYLCMQIYHMARPRANFSMGTVTAPNTPIMPGDPIMIYDTGLGLSTTGKPPTLAVVGSMNYTWGVSGGNGLHYTAPTMLSIQPVTTVMRYK